MAGSSAARPQGEQAPARQQQQQLPRARACRVNRLLEFTDPELEAAWRSERRRTCAARDAVVMLVNVVANTTVLLRLRMLTALPLASRLGLLANLLLSAAHAAAAQLAPRRYERWRTAFVWGARLLRVRVVLQMSLGVAGGGGGDAWGTLGTALHLLFFGPASASLLCTVALPLPLRPHLALQAAVTAASLAHVGALCARAPPGLADARCSVAGALSDTAAAVSLLDLRLPGGGDCCGPVLAAAMVAHNMLLASLAVATLDLASRTAFIRARAGLLPGARASLVRALRVVWASGVVTGLSLLPLVWEVVALAHRLAAGGWAELGPLGVAAAATSLLLEVFMRAWLSLLLLLASAGALAWCAGE
ncbi:hypothetical protein HT031_002453 [Scenedesmus sp. PABB004]|nr:hypothetical protein HT031_002453 [Scenedesmus sp. PABB004]